MKCKNRLLPIAVLVLLSLLTVLYAIGFAADVLDRVGLFPKKTASAAPIAWRTLYPVSDTYKVPAMPTAQQRTTPFDRVSALLSRTESFFRSARKNMPFYDTFRAVGAYTASRWHYGAPYLSGNAYSADNRYFASAQTAYDPEKLRRSADRLTALRSYAEGIGIPLLYIQTPGKVSAHDVLPYGLTDHSNETYDAFLSLLAESGIDALDMRQVLNAQEESYHDLYFNTDHHWKPYAGYLAAKETADRLSSAYGIPLQTDLSEQPFETHTYPGAMFGSNGESACRSIASPEDFSYPAPAFDTAFRLEAPDQKTDLTGTFEEVLVDTERLSEMSRTGGGYAYERFLRGNRPLIRITNLRCENGIKLLVIKDSFALSVLPYLAMTAREICGVDCRPNNGNFTGNLCALIDEFRPDAVLVLLVDPESCLDMTVDPQY